MKRLIKLKKFYQTVHPYYVQKVPCKKIFNRLDLFIDKCESKHVIHFGCTDWPIFNPKNNLHITLSKYTKTLDGFDIDRAGIQNLRKFVDQDYYSDYDNLPSKKYDVCLIPETIEHVDNVELFLKNISKISAKTFLITAPNCLSKVGTRNYYIKNDNFIEVVHPDHNAWYSPYTLKNVIEKYSDLEVKMVYLLKNGTGICCECEKKD